MGRIERRENRKKTRDFAKNKGTLTGGIPGTIIKEGLYTFVVKIREKGKIIGEVEKKIWITKEKYGCRKGKCIDIPDRWVIKEWPEGECQIEKCSCINCYSIAECWNAWTGKNCQENEPCRSIYGTNFSEADIGYVYKIDPTKDEYSCGVEREKIEYKTFRDGKFSIVYPLGWAEEVKEPDDLFFYAHQNFFFGVSKETKIPLEEHKRNFESASEGEIIESTLAEDRYALILEFYEEGFKYRAWTVVFNCENYSYLIYFFWVDPKDVLPQQLGEENTWTIYATQQ